MAIPIGKSGFEYIGKNTTTNKRQRKYTATIRNIETKEIKFNVTGSSCFSSRSGGCSGGSTGSKTFYGLDNKYYHIIVSGTGVKWGQIQPDGAVLDLKSRSVLKMLPFYPVYREVTPVTVIKPKATVVPATIVKPLTDNITYKTPKELEKFYEIPEQRSDNNLWINQILKQIKEIIQTILNLLKPKT